MNHWTGEADVQVPAAEKQHPKAAQAIVLAGQQRRAEALGRRERDEAQDLSLTIESI